MKKYSPTTPARRHATRVDTAVLSKKKPEKSLLLPLKKTGGRNQQGRITVRFRGGGVKRLYRIINFGQEKMNIPGKVTALEYDPNRTAFIALIEYEDKTKGYILAPQGLKVGDQILTAEKTEIRPGNRMKLKYIPVGQVVYNIEVVPNQKGKLVRSAGTSATVLAHEEGYTHLKMPSGEIRKINSECFASIGAVSNPEHRYVSWGKAGRLRLKGKKPHVRGTAMNPVDHPHGGGEGRAGVGMPMPKTPWGKPARGVKTRRRKHTDKFILQRRKKK